MLCVVQMVFSDFETNDVADIQIEIKLHPEDSDLYQVHNEPPRDHEAEVDPERRLQEHQRRRRLVSCSS